MKQKMLITYQFAQSYLEGMLPEELSGNDLQKYFVGDRRDFKSIEDIFEQLIHSAQNYQGMPNVIKYRDNLEKIKEMLLDFDVQKIKKMDIDELYYKFRGEFNVTSTDTKHNSWRKWSCSVIDAAKFMADFKDVDEFKRFVSQFEYNKLTKMALPLLIEQKIKGIGLALACDTLKELGYLSYPKPDVHLMDVYSKLGFSDEDPISVFESIVEMEEVCKEVDPESTPYKLDKIIWLICSGKFYLDDIKVDGCKEDFIELMMKIV